MVKLLLAFAFNHLLFLLLAFAFAFNHILFFSFAFLFFALWPSVLSVAKFFSFLIRVYP